MKRELSFSVALLSALLVCSCKSQSTPSLEFDGKVLEAPLLSDELTDKPVYSDYVASIDTIRLESDVLESYVYWVEDLRCTDDYIFIKSRDGIYAFDYQGKFVRTIRKIGRGRGEYLEIKKFDIQERLRQISIYDLQTASIYVYSFDGVFIKKIPVSQYICEFAALSNGHYLLYNYEDGPQIKGLFEIDGDGKYVKTLFEIPEYYKHIYPNQNFFNHISDDVVSFMSLEDKDIIYHYTNDSLYSAYKINTGVELPLDILQTPKTWEFPDEGYIKQLYYETDRLLSLCIWSKQNYVQLFYDKQKDHLFRMYRAEAISDGSLSDRYPYFRFVYNGRCADFISRDEIMEDPALIKRFPDYDEECNPMIILYVQKVPNGV